VANAHLATCPDCRARLDELRSVVVMLRDLPSVEPARDFSLGPRLVADPPNVVRLRRWYGVARVGAASLAAAFVFLSAGALYVDRLPVGSSAQLSAPAAPAVESAPAAQNAAPTSAPARAFAPAPAAPAAPASAAATPARPADSAPAAGAAAPAVAGAARQQPAPTPNGAGLADQVTAATSVRSLPTPVPTPAPLPTRAPQPVAQPVTSPRVESAAAPLRTAAAGIGILAALGVLATLVIRHRLRAASISATE
jgi:hypothetical protein